MSPNLPHLALSAARGAPGGTGSRPGSRSAAVGAGFLSLELNLLLHPKCRLVKGKPDLHLKVAPAPRRTPRATPGREAEVAEQLFDEVTEIRRVVMEAAGLTQARPAKPIMSFRFSPSERTP
jgi:hypothetical protein